MAIPVPSEFRGEAGQLRRQAISMAINRQEITNNIFSGGHQLAKDFTPGPRRLQRWPPGNEKLKFNADKAKELWAKADAIRGADKAFTIAYIDEGGHKEWVEAMTNQMSNNLGIKADEPVPNVQGNP